jgi:protein SCO1
MAPKALLVIVAVVSWLATAAITVTVLMVGPLELPRDGVGVSLIGGGDERGVVEALPRYSLMPVFELTDQDGGAFGLNDLRGKVWVVDTIFTRCPSICPTLTSGLRDVQSALKVDERIVDDVRLVSISIDGGHDSPGVLKTFADAYGADPGMWTFLTGERSEVWPLVQDGLKLPVEPGKPGDEMDILHSGKLVLIDRAGVIRGYYDGLSGAGRIEMLADLRRLVNEK